MTFGSKVKSFFGRVGAFFKSGWDKTKRFFHNSYNSVKGLAQSIYNKATSIISVVHEDGKAMVAGIGGLAHQTIDAAHELGDRGLDTVGKMGLPLTIGAVALGSIFLLTRK